MTSTGKAVRKWSGCGGSSSDPTRGADAHFPRGYAAIVRRISSCRGTQGRRNIPSQFPTRNSTSEPLAYLSNVKVSEHVFRRYRYSILMVAGRIVSLKRTAPKGLFRRYSMFLKKTVNLVQGTNISEFSDPLSPNMLMQTL